ncbi:MAG: superoxide dismutase [Pseudobdellovibrionaceae bacterium]
MALTLPPLPYAYDALDPYMSGETLEFHHDKHHNAYVVKGNELSNNSISDDELEAAIVKAHKEGNNGLFNQLGQVYNHTLFWNSMKPNGGGKSMPSELEKKISEDLGGYDAFRDTFLKAGQTQFGSGWSWLTMDNATGKLEVSSTSNAGCPLTDGKTPLLTCDVWEHAYYIDYRNLRPKYTEAFFDTLINWEHVAELMNKGPIKAAA